MISDWCHVFVNGTGFLNSWKCMFGTILEESSKTNLSKGQKYQVFMISKAN